MPEYVCNCSSRAAVDLHVGLYIPYPVNDYVVVCPYSPDVVSAAPVMSDIMIKNCTCKLGCVKGDDS